MSDKELIRKVHNGSKEALNTIIEKYYNDIYRFCLYLTGNETDSYDITQDTFLKFIHYVDAYQYRNLKGYLIIIARNLCRDYFTRKKSVTREWEVCDSPFGGQQIENVENKLYLLKLLQMLPIEQREVIILRIYEELKFKEIAKLLKCNLSTTKSRYQLGIANLKKYSDAEEERHGQ